MVQHGGPPSFTPPLPSLSSLRLVPAKVNEEAAEILRVFLDPMIESFDIFAIEETEYLLLQLARPLPRNNLDHRGFPIDGLLDNLFQGTIDLRSPIVDIMQVELQFHGKVASVNQSVCFRYVDMKIQSSQSSNPISIDLDGNEGKSVHIVTLGCSKNTVDSETLAGLLRRNRISLVDEAEGADAVIINTCGFIDLAKEESVNTVLEAAEMRRSGDIGALYVAGCLSERYRDDLEREIPEVDAWFGVTDFTNILRTINPNHRYDLISERYVPSGSRSAYLKISEGCDNPCSFCAIPLMRGGHVSRSADDILLEARHLASEGVRELVVVGQDTTYWGKDLFGERRLASLLEQLGNVRGIEWVRLMYAYPSRFPHDILPVIRETPTICNYMDMPIQHVSDAVLKSMRRGLSRKTMMKLIDRIKSEVPDIALRTTLIVGYPNEGEKEFEELLEFVRFAEFSRLGVFAYSQEENTVAWGMEDPIPAEVKGERIARIMEVQREVSARRNEELTGQTIKVMVEKEVEGEYICRSERDAPEVDGEVYVTSQVALKPGDFVQAEVTGSLDFDLFAEYRGMADLLGDPLLTSLPVL